MSSLKCNAKKKNKRTQQYWPIQKDNKKNTENHWTKQWEKSGTKFTQKQSMQEKCGVKKYLQKQYIKGGE